MGFFGRGISAFFNQFFRWLFWNKTGQKLLFSILIVFIFFCFIKLGEVSAVEEVTDINYEVKSYYDGVVNDFILRIERDWNNLDTVTQNAFLNPNNQFYFYYGNNDGSSYNNARPLYPVNLRVAYWLKVNSSNGNSIQNYDYLGVTGNTMYLKSVTGWDIGNDNNYYFFSNRSVYIPSFIFTYTPYRWTEYINAKKNNDFETITALLEDIKSEEQKISDALTNTDPTSETDSFVDVDTSVVDDISSTQVDNVFSSMTTNFANKFTNYDLTTTYSFVWNLNGTNITFYSDTLYKMIKGTFFETLLSMLWYYIFGHYAFVWLSNIIHKIKDGSILDGLEVNEVITKEML